MNDKRKRVLNITLIIVIFVAQIFMIIKIVEIDRYKKQQKQVVEDVQEETEEENNEPVEVEIHIEEEETVDILTAVKEKDLNKLKELADKEEANSDVAFIVGEMTLQGIGTNANIYDAIKYLQLAAEGGNKKAFLIYSQLLFMGEGSIQQDYEKAAKYAYCIKDDNEEARNMLDIMHKYGMCPETIDTSDITINTLNYSDDETKKAIEELIEELLSKQVYEKYDIEIANVQNMNEELVNQIVIFGKDNWLFWKHPEDGDSYHDYIGDNAYTDAEMAKIAENLLVQKKRVEEKGSKFVLLLIPNKETVYYEYMPEYIKRVDTVTRMDKLVEYLKNNTDITVIYLRDEFEVKKNEVELYYKTDTHTNMKGSFVCVSKVMKDLYDKDLDVNTTRFQVHLRDYCGDIGTSIGREDRYSVDPVYFLPAEAVTEENKVEDSLCLIGDSFSEFLNIELGYYFTGGVDHIMVKDYDYNYYAAMDSKIANLNSDVVIWQVVERFAERLIK